MKSLFALAVVLFAANAHADSLSCASAPTAAATVAALVKVADVRPEGQCYSDYDCLPSQRCEGGQCADGYGI